MAKYSNTIEYNISTKLDPKGLTQLQQQLKQIEISIQKMDNAGSLNSKIADARTQIRGLGNALSEAFNPSLGMVDLAKFNTALKENGVSAVELRNAFQLAGADGQVAFNNLVGQLGQLDLGLKRSSSSLNKIATTFGNTFRWGVIASFFSQFMNAIHSSVDYVKELDDSLTQIMLVTDYNRDSMNAYAKAANEAAKAVGQTTVGMTNASLIFAQQGYDLSQSQELATLSAKLANASQQDTATTSDQITAYMNAYGLSSSIEDLSSALDSWALVANVSAADVAELATASQKAASTANSVGVNMDQLNAQIATIESVTRDAPEQIGNGLKTLYARFSDIKLGKTLEDGVNLGQVTGQLNKLGVQVLDQFGNIRDVGDILEDLMVIWDDLDQTTKEASAQTLAGKFQMNRFLALMDNSDMYREYLGASENAEGTLDQMNEEYLDSLEGRTAKIQASLEGIFSSIFDTDVVYPFIDAMQKFLDILQTLIDSLGGGSTIVLGLVSAFTQLFSNQIAQGINDFNINQAISKQRQENYQNSAATLDRLGAINPNPNDENSQAILNYARKMNEMQPYLSQDQAKQANEILIEMIAHTNDLTKAQQEYNDQMSKVGAIASATFDDKLMAPFEQEDAVNYQMLSEELKNWNNILEGSGEKIAQAKEEWKEFQNALQTQNIQIITEKWQELENIFGGTPFGEKVKAELEKIKAGSIDANESLADLTGGAQRLLELLESYKSGDLRAEDFIKELEKLDQLNARVKMKETTVEGDQRLAEVSSEGMDSQQQIKQIVDTVGALGQLAFAIQSVQNLGSIWKNESLTNSEKLLQIISNLSMVLPTVIGSMKQLTGLDFSSLKNAQSEENLAKKALNLAEARTEEAKATKKAAEEALKSAEIKWMEVEGTGQEIFAEQELSEAKKGLETASKALTGAETTETVAKDAMTAATTKATAAQEAFNVALSKAGIMLAVMAIMAIISAIQNWREEQQKLLEERIETSNEFVSTLKDNQKTIEELYEAWRETGEKSEELTDALNEQAEALGVVVTAADNYETLKEKIDEATASQLAYNAALRGENPEAPSYNLSGIDFSQLSPQELDRLGISVTHRQQVSSKGQKVGGVTTYSSNDYGQTLEEAQRLKEEKNNQLFENQQELLRTNDEERYQELVAENEELSRQIGILDVVIQQNQEAYNYQLETAQNLIQAHSIVSDSQFKEVKSYEEALKLVQQLTLGMDLTEEDQRQLAEDALLWANNLEVAAEAQLEAVNQQIQQNPTLNIPGVELHMGESGFAQLKRLEEDFNLSAEDLVKISDMIDWTDPNVDQHVNEFLNNIRNQLENGLSLDDILFKKGMDEGSLSDEDILQQRRDDIGYVGEDWGRDTEGVKDYADSLQELADISDDIADSLEEDREAALRIADANARLNKGVRSLADSWDDWNKIISDTSEGIEATEDYSDAIQGIEDALTNIFDFDVSTGLADSTQFIKDHMDDIAAAAEGDMDAIERLRIAAAQQILIDADFDWTKLNVSQDELFGLISELNNEEIEVGATLDTTTFGEALAIALQAVGATTKEMQEVFDSLGWEPNIIYETYKVADDSRQTTDGTIEIVDPEAPGGTRTVKVSDEVVFNGNNTVTIPKINAKGTTYQGSAPKIASPSSHSSSGGGGRGKGGGGKGGKGSGGKGGKAKAIEPKEKKEHEKDYYEEVNSQLDKTEKILSRIEKEEDRLIGDKARANQNKQLTLLQKEIKLNEEKLKINKQELKDTDERLKQQDKLAEQILKQQGISMNIPNPVFDEDGVIANFEQINKALDDAHNKLIDKYNAAAKAGNEELTKEIEKQISKFDDYSKNLLDAAKRHDALQSEIEETTNALEELKDAIEDIQIAAYKAGIEAGKKFEDIVKQGAQIEGFFRDFDPNSFVNSFSIDERPYEHLIEDLTELETLYKQNEEAANQFYDAMIAKKKEDLKNANSKEERQAIQASIDYFQKERDRGAKNQLDYWSGRLGELQEWMNNPKAEGNPFGDNTAELQEVFENVTQAALDSAENFRKKLQDVRNDLLDMYDEFDDELDRQFDKYDDLVDKVEQMADVYTLYYGEDSYTELVNILQREGEILQSELDERTKRYQEAEVAYQQALETGDKKTIEAMEDRMRDAEKEMRDTAQQLAETWVKQFETSIKRSMQTMTQNVWGQTTGTLNDDGTVSNITLGLEDLQTKWELEKQYIEDYKDEVERAYEIDKLRSKYVDLLNDAQGASLGTQNKIRQQMQEQLDYLKNQTTMSEYDVKLANAKLEVLQKQIALEDAQRNKNKMQLRRDTQGNYRYVYRADEGDIKQAQDELLDSSFDAYELTKDQTITNNDRMINSFLDFQEKASAIAEKYKDDEVARKAALQTLTEEYTKIWKAMGEDFKDVTNGMYDVLWWNINNLIGDSATASIDMMNLLFDENGNIKDKTGEMWRDLATFIQNDVIDQIYTEATKAIYDINVSGNALSKNMTSSLNTIGASAENLNKELKNVKNTTDSVTNATKDLFNIFDQDDSKFQKALKKIKEYAAALADVQSKSSALAGQLADANAQIAALTKENEAYRTQLNQPSGTRTTNPSGGNPSGGSPSTRNPGGGTPSTGNPGGGTPNRGNPGGGTPNRGYPGGKLNYYDKIVKAIKKKGSKWATGGYTGTWNGSGDPETGDGKLIWVHQKELILNAKDTENILDAVNLMRDMVSIIQIDALGKTLKSNINNADKNFGDTIEQRVEINATFPNVTNSNEIETALLGLSDKAYQYSYRTR